MPEKQKLQKKSSHKHLGIFENSPISFWVEDFSKVKVYLDDLRAIGIIDLHQHLTLNTDELIKISSLIEVLDINLASMNMFQVSSKEELSRKLGDYFNEESISVFKEEIVAMASGETHFESLIPIKHPNGNLLMLELRLNILKEHISDWSRVIVSFMDVTLQKKAEEELRKANALLEESNSTKNKLFSIIAHDLQSPFNSILGFTNMLVEDYDTLNNQERKLYLEVVNNSAVNALERLRNLLSWSRSQLDKLEINKKLVDLKQLVDESIEAYSLSAQMKHITTHVLLDEKVLIFIDKHTISSVIGNLYINAIKFTSEQGRIDIWANPQDKFVELIVKDNGVGIPADEIEHIFDLGGSGSKPGTNNEKGTGLGLILCKDFVEKNGGSISVESIEGEGSLFKVKLPKYY